MIWSTRKIIEEYREGLTIKRLIERVMHDDDTNHDDATKRVEHAIYDYIMSE